MKYMIASDIHGSERYCKDLLDAMQREQADKLLLLGDLLYHGPRNPLPEGYSPQAVAELLNAHKQQILCVRGNCDSEVDQMMLEFPIMAEYCLIPCGERMVFVTHGHKMNKANPPMLKAGDVLMNGHFHIPACEEVGNYIYMNPGSVSIPKEDSAHSYMIMEDNVFTWKDLDGREYMRKEL